ncbi:MAG: T9SS C-terminal target domain-containing protein [Calditrichaeota bacterium]|nr:MAG: T9SS C-terminal target domain-containing protein [Calditrichota bacterium]
MQNLKVLITALILGLSGLVVTLNAQTFVAMRVNIAGVPLGTFLQNSEISQITATYNSTFGVNPIQTFVQGPSAPNTNGFSYIPPTGNLTFNLANFGASLTFNPSVFLTTFQFDLVVTKPNIAGTNQSISTGAFVMPTVIIGPNPVDMGTLTFDDSLPPYFPNIPTNITLQNSEEFAFLKWQDPAITLGGDPLTNLSKIVVVRSGVSIDTVDAGIQNYVDFNVPIDTSSTPIEYKLKALGSAGEISPLSFPVSKNFKGETYFHDLLEEPSNWNFTGADSTVGWSIDGSPNKVISKQIPFSGAKCLNYNNGTFISSQTGINFATATYNQTISLANLVNPILSFQLFNRIESNSADVTLEISNDNFSTILQSVNYNSDNFDWEEKLVPLSSSWQNIQIRFKYFDVSPSYNFYSGVFIDDLKVKAQKTDSFPTAFFEPFETTENSATPFNLTVQVYDSVLVPNVDLHWRNSSSASFTISPMQNFVSNDFTAQIPPQPIGTEIEYFISMANANSVTKFSPQTAPVNFHSFVFENGFPPENFTTISNLDSIVQLKWETPDTTNYSYSAFKIYRSTNPNDLVYPIGQQFLVMQFPAIFSNEFFDVNLNNGTTYYYKAASIFTDSSGITSESYPSKLISAIPEDVLPPSTPTNLTFEKVNFGQIKLNWNDPTTDNKGNPLNDLTEIKIYRSETQGGFYELIGTVSAGVETFNDFYALTEERFYALTALDEKGNESRIPIFDSFDYDQTYGGPDNFGYIWLSSQNGLIPFEFENISTYGTPIGLYGDDVSAIVNLPWFFPFYQGYHFNFLVSTNGYLTFGNDGNSTANTIISPIAPNDVIAPFWEDLKIQNGISEIFTHYDSTDNKFIIQWNKALSSPSKTNTFQVILHQEGEINFNYENINENLSSVTAGIENPNGNDGLETSFSGGLLQDNFSVKFLKNAEPILVPLPPQNTSNFQNPYEVFTHISTPATLSGNSIFWKTSTATTFTTDVLTLISGDFYKAEIPPQPNGTLIQYYFSATNFWGTTTSPENTPTNLHQFVVSSDLPPSNFSAESNHDERVPLSWFYPTIFSFVSEPSSQNLPKKLTLKKSDFKSNNSKKKFLAKINGGNYPLTVDSLNLETFRIYRSTNPSDLSQPNSTFLIYETPDALTLDYFDSDSTLTNGSEYFYTITSVFMDTVSSSILESLPTEIVSAIPQDLVPPANPSNISFNLIPPLNKIELTWNDPTTDLDGFPLDDFASVNLYKKDEAKNLTFLSSIQSGTETFLDENPQNGNNFYLFSTIDTKGNESDLLEFTVVDTIFHSEESEGYIWVSSETGMFQESFSNIATLSGVVALGIFGYDNESVQTLPWSFPFFGQSSTTLRISSKGFVILGNNPTPGLSRTFLPNPTTPDNIIAPLWADLAVFNGIGEVYYLEDLANQRVIIQWTNLIPYGDLTNSITNTFQLELHEDGKILFHYDQLNAANSLLATIGVENSNGTKGFQIGYDSPILQSNTSYLITKNYLPKINSLTKIYETDEFDQNIWIQADISQMDLTLPNHYLNWKFTTDTNYNKVPLVSGTNFIPAPNQLDVEIEYFVSATDSLFTFANSFYPIDLGTNSISPYQFKVRLIPPGNLTAESNVSGEIPLTWQEAGLNTLRYDDGTSEFADSSTAFAGLNATTQTTFANVFEVFSEDLEVTSVEIYFVDVVYPLSNFKVKVFDFDSTTNAPGAVLAQTSAISQFGLSGEFIEINSGSSGVPVGNKFCVGIEQFNSSPIGLGGDTTLNSPYEFQPNTFFVKEGLTGSWNPIETLPQYGEVIPMIRVNYGKKDTVVVANSISRKKNFLQLNPVTKKSKVSQKTPNKINSFPTWQLLNYKLYKMLGVASSAEDVVTNGTLIFTDTTKAFVDSLVMNPNFYSYTVTATYDVNGNTLESKPENLAIATPSGTPQVSFSDLDFGIALINDSLFADFKIENLGTAPLEISDLNFSNPNIFGVKNANFPLNVLPQDSTKIQLFCFSPTPAIFNEEAFVLSNSPTSPDTVSIFAEIVLSTSESLNEIPKVFSLEQNFPNPFNPTTTIKFGIPKESFVNLTVFNVLGQKVKTLVSEELQPSFYSLKWDGTNDFKKIVSSGVYFYKIETENFRQTRKLLFLK